MYYEKSFLGTGVNFPVNIDKTTGQFLESSHEEDIKQAIYIIIMTRKGERVMRPEFGCDIHDYAFEAVDYTVSSLMQKAVQESIILYEPRVRDIKVQVDVGDIGQGKVWINIEYIVRQTNNPYNLVYPFYINEGIEL